MSVVQKVVTLVSAPAATSVNGEWFQLSKFVSDPMIMLCFEISGGTLTVEGALNKDHPHTILTTTGDGYHSFPNRDGNWEYIRAIKTSASDLGRVEARIPR